MDKIEPFLKNKDTFLLCHYFYKEINNFESFIQSKDKPGNFDESFFQNVSDIDQLIKYGYHTSSIEFCLKYDMIDDLVVFDKLNQEARWSPFEWGYKPEYLDLLSFTGFFGAIKCFKFLLIKGLEINDNVTCMVVCSGCFELFHLCEGQRFVTPKAVCKASAFFHLSLLVFMLENGAMINAKDDCIEFC